MQAFLVDRAVIDLPPEHRFPSTKYQRLRERVARYEDIRIVEALPAETGQLLLAHAASYVEAVDGNGLSLAEQRAIGFAWSATMAGRARRSVGATIAAARAALAEGVAANLAGGTHHASASRGSGYCIFNDVAVAARVLQREARDAGASADAVPRIAVVDLDVHQGDGTAAIFAGDPSVWTLSLHGARNFPFRKAESDLDVPLPDGCSDAAYLAALDGALEVLWREHERDAFAIVFYLAGADPHEGDRLGRLAVTAAGLLARDRRVLDAAGSRRVPVALSMAGGYGRDIEDTVAVQEATILAALDAWRAWG